MHAHAPNLSPCPAPPPLAAASRRVAAALAALALRAPAGASTLVIEGAGDGHGVGMSQDGALGLRPARLAATRRSSPTTTRAPRSARRRRTRSCACWWARRWSRVPLERYVRGVVSAEMPSSWPLAALEAQAIASRTYALTGHAGGSRFDVYADTRSQVYEGAAAETAQTNAAVAATAGQIVTYAGKPAITYFFASSGGMTENIENSFLGSEPEPWLRGVPDPYETGSSSWKLSMSFAAAAARLRGLVKGILPRDRGAHARASRRGSSPPRCSARAATARVSGPELAGRLGLHSTWAYFSVKSGASVDAEPDLSGTAARRARGARSPPPTPRAPRAAGRRAGAGRRRATARRRRSPRDGPPHATPLGVPTC